MKSLVAALAAAASLACAAQVPPIDAEVAARTVREDVLPKLVVRFAGGVVAHPDVEYANLVGFRPLLLDLYTQEDAAASKPRPLVVWIHGGGWTRGDSRTSGAFADFPAVLAAIAARGYVVASVNYRLAGEARFPAPLQDVKAALAFLHRNASAYGIDPTRTVLWGGSAGGHLAALAAASCGIAAFEPGPSDGRVPRSRRDSSAPAPSPCVQAAVIWYGIFDLDAFADSPLLPPLLGCQPRDCPDELRRANPIGYVNRKTPPMLLIHGAADRTAPLAQSEAMAARLRQAGVPVQTLWIPGVDHGLLGRDPQATRSATLLALQRTLEFLEQATR